jgi:hypothetical protein
MYRSAWLRVRGGRNPYDHLTFIGTLDMPKLPEFSDPEPSVCSLNKFLSEDVYNELRSLAGDFVNPRQNRANAEASVKKIDKEPCYLYKEHKCFPRAIEIVADRFSEALTASFFSVQETVESIDWTKSSGYVETVAGFKKKMSMLIAGYLVDVFDISFVEEDVCMIWKACCKENEWLERSDHLIKKKIRTFIVEPLVLLFHHKRLYAQIQF